MASTEKIVVSGSSGMIGTAFCEKLLEKKVSFVGIDQKPNAWNSAVQEKTILTDLRQEKNLEQVPVPASAFIHFAANPYVFPSVQNPALAIDNINMTLNCLEFCRKNKINRFIFASSREVYGNAPEKKHAEKDLSVEQTESPYAASKIAGEAFIHAYQKCFGIDFVILRFSNVYGRYDNSERLIPQVIRRCRKNEPITLFGEKKELPFTYLDDTVEGTWSAFKQFETAKNNVFNIASPQSIKIRTVIETIQKNLHSDSPITVAKSLPGEVVQFKADTSKAQSLLGFSAKTDIQQGLQKTLAWYQKNILY